MISNDWQGLIGYILYGLKLSRTEYFAVLGESCSKANRRRSNTDFCGQPSNYHIAGAFEGENSQIGRKHREDFVESYYVYYVGAACPKFHEEKFRGWLRNC